MIEAAPFPIRPDSVRPADMLGPYDGIVLDADTDRPIVGATVAAAWAFERGIGFQAPAGAHEFVTETGADGRYIIPKLDDLPGGASMRVRRFTLIVYHRGHVAWRSDRLFPGREARRDFSQRGSRVRLERWQSTLRHAEHVLFLGGGARVRTVAAWELQAAALELEGQQAPAIAAGTGEPSAPAVATTAVPLDITKLLSDDEIRGVTGYVGKFEDGKLADLPTTEVLRQPALQGRGQGGELRRRPAGLAPRHRGCRGPVSQADEHAARSQDDRRSRRRLLPCPFGRHRRAGLPGARTRRGRVDDLRRIAVHGAGQLVKLAKLVESRSPSCRPRRRGSSRRRSRRRRHEGDAGRACRRAGPALRTRPSRAPTIRRRRMPG